ncbi:MAG: STAS domain-containing protein [Solirubrobacteraceae bacterium]
MSDGRVSFEPKGHFLVARMAGEIDLSNAEQLGVKIAEATSPDAQGVALDLTEVSHIDSYGIFVIHGLRQRLCEHQTTLVLVIPRDGRIHRAMELMGIHEFIPVMEGLEDALLALG